MQNCLQRPEVEAYVRALHGEIIDAWTYPESVPPDQAVVLRFALHASGAISSPAIASSSYPGLGRTALAALRRAAPFAALGDRVRCLAGMRVEVELSNPSAPGS